MSEWHGQILELVPSDSRLVRLIKGLGGGRRETERGEPWAPFGLRGLPPEPEG